MEKKKRTVKKMEITLYVLAAISLVCAVLMAIGAISYIHSYYSSYGMSIASGWKDAVQYILNNSGNWVVFTLLFFAAARIVARLDAINPEFGKKQKKNEAQPEAVEYSLPETDMMEKAAENDLEEAASTDEREPSELV